MIYPTPILLAYPQVAKPIILSNHFEIWSS